MSGLAALPNRGRTLETCQGHGKSNEQLLASAKFPVLTIRIKLARAGAVAQTCHRMLGQRRLALLRLPGSYGGKCGNVSTVNTAGNVGVKAMWTKMDGESGDTFAELNSKQRNPQMNDKKVQYGFHGETHLG